MFSIYVASGTEDDWLEGYIACMSAVQSPANYRQFEPCHGGPNRLMCASMQDRRMHIGMSRVMTFCRQHTTSSLRQTSFRRVAHLLFSDKYVSQFSIYHISDLLNMPTSIHIRDLSPISFNTQHVWSHVAYIPSSFARIGSAVARLRSPTQPGTGPCLSAPLALYSASCYPHPRLLGTISSLQQHGRIQRHLLCSRRYQFGHYARISFGDSRGHDCQYARSLFDFYDELERVGQQLADPVPQGFKRSSK